MTTPQPTHHEAESSHTDDAFAKSGSAVYREYLLIWGILMGLLVITVVAAEFHIPEPFSFLVALIIAVVKATLVILFFMHVKDASRVTWVFCGCSFIWLAIMFVLTFTDYLSRPTTGVPLPSESHSPAQVESSH